MRRRFCHEQQGFTHSQIVRDLKEFVHDEQTQPRTSKRGRKGEGRRKARRKPIAERLYSQGFKMEAIATQLGVTKGTISKDLAGIVSIGNNQKPAKTASNPKGAGRRKVARR
jgi:DNA-binding NarL/FixJ family response regulator